MEAQEDAVEQSMPQVEYSRAQSQMPGAGARKSLFWSLASGNERQVDEESQKAMERQLHGLRKELARAERTVLELKEKGECYRHEAHRMIAQKEASLRQAEADYRHIVMRLEQDVEKAMKRAIQEHDLAKMSAEKAQRANDELRRLRELEKIHVALSDEEIRHWLETRSGIWYRWAKKYARKDKLQMMDNMADTERKDFRSVLAEFMPRKTLADDFPERDMPLAIVLQAFLTQFLCLRAFRTWYWMFEALSLSHMPSDLDSSRFSGMDDKVESIYEMLSQVLPREGRECELHLIRTLVASGLGDGPNERELVKNRRLYAWKLRKEFLQKSFVSVLLAKDHRNYHDDDDDAVRELEAEIDTVLAFAASRRAEGREFSWHYPRGCHIFSTGEMEELSLHPLQDTGELERLNGMPISMVVQPGILVTSTTATATATATATSIGVRPQVWVEKPKKQTPADKLLASLGTNILKHSADY